MKTWLKYLLLPLTSFLVISTTNAASLAAVNPDACKLLKNPTKPFILVVKRGDDLIESITNCANAANITSASLSGLGALEEPTLGYFNLSTKKYQFKTFPGIYELTSLNGNVGFANGQRFAHIHVTIGDDNYHIIGGHLNEAKVGATAEITFIPLPAAFTRKADKNTGMKLIATQQ